MTVRCGIIVVVGEFRFVAGEPDELHSSSWTVSSQANSFYVISRHLKGSLKVSVHPPGPLGSDRAFFYGADGNWVARNPDGMVPPDGPRIEQYYPRPIGPGVCRVATIRIRHEAVRYTDAIRGAGKLEWFEAPPVGMALNVHLLLVDRRKEAVEWCRAKSRALVGGLVDQSSLGDLLIYAEQAKAPDHALVISGSHSDVDAVSIAMESVDGSIALEETPFVPLSRGSV